LPEAILPPTTAGIYPARFSDSYAPGRRTLLIALAIFLLTGLALRTNNLAAESLSEDELNKLQTVAEYRAEGLTGRNGEHPFLMKGLQTMSIFAAEKWNAAASMGWKIPDEAALRFPTALFGTLTALLIFFLVNELFGPAIALISAALWAVDPNAIGFDRIAKEDSFLLFFFLLANIFWLRGQSRAERGACDWQRYIWPAAVGFGAMLASKYLVHLFAVSIAYFEIFVGVSDRWRFGKARWIKFYALLGISFVIFNPTILLPETWRQMLLFSGEKRIVHDAYEFAGTLYRNQISLWLAGVPWTFYYVFVLVKTPLLTLLCFFLGIPHLFRRKLGDGRFFIFFWAFMWFVPFTFLGGKFTRYFVVVEPLVLLTAAIGVYFSAKWLADRLPRASLRRRRALVWSFPLILIAAALGASLSAAPFYRLYHNPLTTGFYFPHDEFYDTSTRQIVAEIASRARPGATVANETPYLFEYYGRQTGRADLVYVSLSDKSKIADLAAGDFIVAARGRRYFSNDAYLQYLESFAAPSAEIRIGRVTSAKIYQLDEATAARIRELAK